jgi:hypothetical protein
MRPIIWNFPVFKTTQLQCKGGARGPTFPKLEKLEKKSLFNFQKFLPIIKYHLLNKTWTNGPKKKERKKVSQKRRNQLPDHKMPLNTQYNSSRQCCYMFTAKKLRLWLILWSINLDGTLKMDHIFCTNWHATEEGREGDPRRTTGLSPPQCCPPCQPRSTKNMLTIFYQFCVSKILDKRHIGAGWGDLLKNKTENPSSPITL